MKQIFFSIWLLTFNITIFNVCAQSNTVISGYVHNEYNEPLAYANVYFADSFEGTMTERNGHFKFSTALTGKQKLICTFIGYQQFEEILLLEPDSQLNVNIVLQQTEIAGKTVKITASAFTASDEEGVTLSSLDVVRTPGAAADIFWAIKTFPGVQQVEEGAGLFVRGGDVSETITILDGAIINHPYKYESPTGGFFGTFSPFLLKGTFFSSGGFSARYGNALSGALVMESHDLPAIRNIGLGIGLAAESASISMPIIDDKLGFSFSGNRSNTKMMFELNNCRKDFSHYPTSYDANFALNCRLNSEHSLKFFLFRSDDNVGVEVDDPDYDNHFYGDTSNRIYNLIYAGVYHEKLLVNANIALTDFRHELSLSVMDLDITERLYQARLTAEWSPNHDILFRSGVIVLQGQSFISGQVPEEELDLSPTAPIETVDTDYRSDRFAQFIETEFPALLGCRLTAGVRGEYESISAEYFIDPRVSLSYPISTSSNFTAAVGIYHQYPEPYYYDPYVGNPKLSSMKAVHLIAGYAYQQDNKLCRIEGFYKDYDHLLLENEQLNYTNQGYGYAYGLDIFLKNSYGPLSGWLSYSWLTARRKWMDLPLLRSPYFDITHNATMVLIVNLPFQLSVGCSFRYATGKPYSPEAHRYNELRVPDYSKLDVTFSYMYSYFSNNLTVFYLGLSNVLNRTNIFDYRYSADYERRAPVESSFGRSIYFGCSFNLN